jgi:NAD-specific glutamate dehydrogenase
MSKDYYVVKRFNSALDGEPFVKELISGISAVMAESLDANFKSKIKSALEAEYNRKFELKFTEIFNSIIEKESYRIKVNPVDTIIRENQTLKEDLEDVKSHWGRFISSYSNSKITATGRDAMELQRSLDAISDIVSK